MEDIYNNSTYLSNNPHWHKEDALVKARAIQTILKEKGVSYASVAEIGCGTGEVLLNLKTLNNINNIVYKGFDISKEAIALAQKKQVANLSFECIDITKVNTPLLFDLILVIDVIEHLHDYFTFLASLVTKSKYSVFHIPLDMFVWSLFREKMLIESKERVGHIHNFTEDFILSILNDYGYKVILKKYTEPDYLSANMKQAVINAVKRLLFKLSPRFCSKTLGGYSLLVLCENTKK